MKDDIFQEVDESDTPIVLQALKQNWPNNFPLFQMLTILAEYKKAGSTWEYALYKYGDYQNGVYLIKVLVKLPGGINYPNIYFCTPSSDMTALRKALLETQIIPWELEGYMLQMIPSIYVNIIEEVYAAKRIAWLVHKNTMFWYPPDKEIHIQPLPDDVYIRFLDKSHAAEMDINWPHRFPGSEFTHEENLEKHFGIGLFRKSDNKMLSSALSNFTGGIFVLFSYPEFRGRGYAGFVLQHMVRELKRRSRIPFGTVIIGNKSSESVFKKVGFEVFAAVSFILPDLKSKRN